MELINNRTIFLVTGIFIIQIARGKPVTTAIGFSLLPVSFRVGIAALGALDQMSEYLSGTRVCDLIFGPLKKLKDSRAGFPIFLLGSAVFVQVIVQNIFDFFGSQSGKPQ